MCDLFKDKEQNNVNSEFLVLQLDLTFHLFVCTLAGAGAAVIAMVRTIILISDWPWAGGTNWH